MFIDVAELREFYTSPLGQLVQRHLRRKVRALWPNLRGQRVLALGYGTPVLRPLLDEAERVIAFMPSRQGVVPWPQEGPNRTALVDETGLPLLDASVDRIILMHAIECAPERDALMEEIWRVLTSSGRLLVVAPNRSGFWARSDATPFGAGAAFSVRQIKLLLRQHLFIPENEARALFFPPLGSSFWRSTAAMWERLGQRWLGALAGVHVIEAAKQLYAPAGKRIQTKTYALRAANTASARLRVS